MKGFFLPWANLTGIGYRRVKWSPIRDSLGVMEEDERGEGRRRSTRTDGKIPLIETNSDFSLQIRTGQ